MRQLADAERIGRFMAALGAEADSDGACYFTGGATAVLVGWRRSTIGVDVKFSPESDRLLRAIQRLKDELEIKRRAGLSGRFPPGSRGLGGPKHLRDP